MNKKAHLKLFKIKAFFLMLFFGLLNGFSQTATYSWSGYTAGALTYTTGILTTSITTNNLNAWGNGYSSPKYFAGATVGSGQCGIAGGLALEVFFGNITNSYVQLVMDFSNAGGSNGTCASVQFNIEDINADESTQGFDDYVDISAVDGNGAAIAAASIVVGLGSNTYKVTGATKQTIIGHTNSAYGSRSTSACNITSITVTPPAGVPLNTITLKYYPDYTPCGNCYWNFSGPRPAFQYISIGPLNATGTSGCTITLPVELTSFSGKCGGVKKTLHWSTASELNNKYFTIEHSKDGSEFEEMAIVDGHGNSLQKLDYEYSFAEEKTAYKYYRLKQTDNNGKTTVLKTIYLDCVDKLGLINLFPNPATNQINLAFESPDESEFFIQVTDITGRVVKSINYVAKQGSNDLDLNIESFEKGMYAIVISDVVGTARAQTLKFIKNN
jgi:hypothetical protein